MATHVFMAAAGMLFVGAGLWVLTLPLTDGDRKRIVGGVLALSFITFLGVFLTWVALTGRTSRGFAFVLGLAFDAIALVAWPVMLFSLWQQLTGSRKAAAPWQSARRGATNARAATPRTLRRFRMTRHHVVFALAAILITLTAVTAVAQGQSGDYTIGVPEPLTGPLAGEGTRHLEGLEIVRDMINERGGVMGKKLTFALADATDPTVAASEANRLITREGVKIIIGTFSSRLCGAASEVAARHDVIYWESSCVDPRFNKRGLKHVYRTEIDATGFGWYNVEFIAKHLAPRLNLKPNQLKIAFLSEDSSYGQGVTESARQRAKAEFGLP